MLGDAHSTNWAENFQFFINQNNPTNFQVIWERAYMLYRRIGSISHRPVPFDQVMDYSVIQKLGQEEKYAKSKVEYESRVAPKDVQSVRTEGEEILTNTVVIHFFPNSFDPMSTIERTVNGKKVEERYDPNVENVLKEIAQLAGQFGNRATIAIEGYTDGSMKGQVLGRGGQGTFPPLRAQRHQGSPDQQVQRARPQSIQRRRPGMGPTGRPAQPDQESTRRDQGAHGREGELMKDLRFALRRRLPTWQAVLMGAWASAICLVSSVVRKPGLVEERTRSP